MALPGFEPKRSEANALPPTTHNHFEYIFIYLQFSNKSAENPSSIIFINGRRVLLKIEKHWSSIFLKKSLSEGSFLKFQIKIAAQPKEIEVSKYAQMIAEVMVYKFYFMIQKDISKRKTSRSKKPKLKIFQKAKNSNFLFSFFCKKAVFWILWLNGWA